MKRLTLPLLAAAVIAAPASAAEIQIAATGPVVELNVTENVEAEPDIVTVSAGVTTEARTAVEAMRTNAEATNRVVDRIKQLGVAERDIQTTGISLGAQYDYDQGARRQVFRGYQASNRVSVKLRQIDRTGEVLDALVAAGATDLGGPDWSIDDDTAARAQARRQAMETARAQALEYARAAGYADVRLLEISETIASQPPMPFLRTVNAEAAQAASTPVQPGLVQAGVTVRVVYEMTR
ncbi:MAG TPA: SIMPL domain-containing protein [Croceibacterium sp.]|nr:SIMPL domain-containing protein [Croceibacterium sp.]